MGIYINPTSGTKEEWLNKNYLLITDKPSLQINPGDILSIADFKTMFPVCLVDNGLFTAAAVADDRREFDNFHTNDGRLKVWYIVKLEDLLKDSSGLTSNEKEVLKSRGK